MHFVKVKYHICDIYSRCYISHMRYWKLKKNKIDVAGLKFIICTVKDRESEKTCEQNNAEVICVLAFRGQVWGQVGGGLAPMVGKLSCPF